MFLHSLFVQDHKDQEESQVRNNKPWYRRAVEAAVLWKRAKRSMSNRQKLKKSSSLRIASSFTHVCLCAPISSHDEVFLAADDTLPRRSTGYRRSKSLGAAAAAAATAPERGSEPRASVGSRRVFRGKSLTDDVLMRRFVVEEEAMLQIRRRNEVEIIKRRSAIRRGKLGPSRLSRMAMA